MSKHTIGTFGYWIDKKKEMPELNELLPDLASRPGIEALVQFEKSDEGLRIMCADYLNGATAALSEKGLSPWKTGSDYDLHSFMLINDGKYRDKFLHLQAYPRTISTGRNIIVSAYIKEEPEHNTPNVGPSWQKHLSLDDEYRELVKSVEDLLK